MTQIFTSAARQIKLGGLTLFATENAPSVREISHSLAQINRFTGHCKRPYSVAEHSLLAADTARVVLGVSPIVELAVLFHDAHECLCGDTSTPVKQMLGYVWRSFEYSLQRMVLSHYRLGQVFDANEALIKRCDLIALATERRDLLPYDSALHDPWLAIDSTDAPHNITPRGIDLMSEGRANTPWNVWADSFEIRAHHLIGLTAQPTPSAMVSKTEARVWRTA
jgi:hypothetical protein